MAGSDLSCRITTQGLITLLLRAICAICSTQPSSSDFGEGIAIQVAVNGITVGETVTELGPYWDAYLWIGTTAKVA